MSSNLIRQYIDILNEDIVVSQQDLMTSYQKNPIKPDPYRKVEVEAIVPANSELGKKFDEIKGKVDQATYKIEQPYRVLQGIKKPPSYDIYTNSKEDLENKMSYNKPSELLTNALKVLEVSLEDIKKSGGGLFMKKTVTYMIPASALNVEGKTIDAGWGTQQVQQGGFLVLEGYPNVTKIYCVNPDADGLPIAYIKV